VPDLIRPLRLPVKAQRGASSPLGSSGRCSVATECHPNEPDQLTRHRHNDFVVGLAARTQPHVSPVQSFLRSIRQ